MKKIDLKICETTKLKVTDDLVNQLCDSTTVKVKKHKKGDFDGLVQAEMGFDKDYLIGIIGIRIGRMPTTDKELADALPNLFAYVDNRQVQLDWVSGMNATDNNTELPYVKFMFDAVIGKLLRDRV